MTVGNESNKMFGMGFCVLLKICISCTHVDSFLSVSLEPYGFYDIRNSSCSICYCDDVLMTRNQKHKNLLINFYVHLLKVCCDNFSLVRILLEDNLECLRLDMTSASSEKLLTNLGFFSNMSVHETSIKIFSNFA